MTDSGSLQKGAFFFKKPCMILSAETEWVELANRGFYNFVGANKDLIKQAYESQDFTSNFNMNLYGNGLSSKNIVEALINFNELI